MYPLLLQQLSCSSETSQSTTSTLADSTRTASRPGPPPGGPPPAGPGGPSGPPPTQAFFHVAPNATGGYTGSYTIGLPV